MTKILSDKYPLLLILHLARLSCSCDLVMCVCTHHNVTLNGLVHCVTHHAPVENSI